jgi:alpha-N-arabinofuranosidase
MREWVEYLTSDSGSTLAQLRRSNGREKPWRVRYFGVGNENWGCGGNMTAEYYADLYRRYATYVRNFSGNQIVKVANGPSGRDMPFMDTLIRRAHRHMQAVSMHYYVLPTADWSAKGPALGFPESEWFSVVRQSYEVEELIDDYVAILDEVDPEKKIALYVDEWGTWYDRAPDAKSALYQQNTVRDAVSAAIFLNTFHDYSDRIRMTNIAQVANVLQAMLLTDNAEMLLTPTYHVFEMYNVHQNAKAVPIEYLSPQYTLGGQSVDALSLTASLSSDGSLNLSMVNSSPNRPGVITCILNGFEGRDATGRVLTGPSMDSHNTFVNKTEVSPRSLEGIQLEDNQLTVTLPPKSVSTIVVR